MSILLLTAAAWAGSWRTSVGAEINADPHGAADVGYRSGAWSAELLTDTLQLQYAPEQDRGRWWVAGRAEAAFAELLAFPWAEGAPAPELGFAASYLGAEGGWMRYLPGGFYVGAQGHARRYRFSELGWTAAAVPDGRGRLRAELVAGWWSPTASASAVAGGQQSGGSRAPHAQGALRVRPDWTVAPLVMGWGGVGEGQDFLTRSRMGGLNPYVIPLAGAGWAEWWVEDYGVLRAGPSAQLGPVRLEAVGDLGWSDVSGGVWGLGLLSRTQPETGRWFVQADLGYGGGVARAPGVGAASVWVLVGMAWDQPEG